MPEVGGGGHSEDAEKLEDGAGDVDGAEEACVQRAAAEGAEEEEEEDLDAADPGDGGWSETERCAVVFLEDAIASDPAPGAEDGQVSHGCLRPGSGASVGWRTRIPS